MEISPATDQIVFNAEKFRELLVYVSKEVRGAIRPSARSN